MQSTLVYFQINNSGYFLHTEYTQTRKTNKRPKIVYAQKTCMLRYAQSKHFFPHYKFSLLSKLAFMNAKEFRIRCTLDFETLEKTTFELFGGFFC
jgi:hypothetical protein